MKECWDEQSLGLRVSLVGLGESSVCMDCCARFWEVRCVPCPLESYCSWGDTHTNRFLVLSGKRCNEGKYRMLWKQRRGNQEVFLGS